MSNILNTALNFMGFLTTEKEDDGSKIENMPIKKENDFASLHFKTSQPTIVHMTPEAFDEVLEISKSLQDKKIVTINLALVDVALRNQIIDFASGTVYALNGEIMKLAENVYLLAGQGVTVQESQRDSSKFPWSKVPK